jgi:hypothetical protein
MTFLKVIAHLLLSLVRQRRQAEFSSHCAFFAGVVESNDAKAECLF